MDSVELIYDQPCAVGESPIWDQSLNALWWVDIVRNTVHRLFVSSGQHRSWRLPEMVGTIARASDGRWVAAMEAIIARVEFPEDGEARIVEQFPVAHREGGMRCNDGRCDRQGRFVVSTMYNDMSAGKSIGVLLKLDEIGLRRFFEKSFIVGNGLAFSGNGRKMYISDSHPSTQKVWVCDYGVESGLAHSPQAFIDFSNLPGRPDGAAIDVDDCYWICANDGSAVYRFTPDGKLDRQIGLPVKKPSMCAFGGANMETLFITSIRPEGVDLSDQPLAGSVFAVKPGTQGLEEPLFRY